MQPLISVIIPVYNHTHVLKKTIEGVFNQTYRPLEVIIINDGSTDNFDVAVSVIPIEVKEFLNLKIINQENKGAPSARNCGFASSKGEYVIFWDADTVPKANMLEKMFEALQKNPQASYAYSQFKFGWKIIKSQNFDAEKLKQVNYIDTSSLIRRSVLSPPYQGGVGVVAGAGPWDESLKRFQDWDLWLSMLEQGKTGVFVPEVLYKKIVGGRIGISNWMPSFMFKLPWKTERVRKYEEAREIIFKKYKL